MGTMNSPYELAIAQEDAVLGGFAANLERHLAMIGAARDAGAELCVFPELSLTGYFLKDLVPELAIRLDDPKLYPLLEQSRRMALVVGLVEESADHCFYNTACFFDGGELVHAHRKIYLPTYGLFEEQRYFASGRSVRAFDTRLGRFAMLTCEDMWHAIPPLVAAQDGATQILVPSAGPLRGASRRDERLDNGATWEVLNRFHAKANGVFVAYANRVGVEDGVTFGGGSEVVSPSGVSLARAPGLEADLLRVRIDPAEVRRERRDSPLYRDENLDLAIRELIRVRDARLGGGANDR